MRLDHWSRDLFLSGLVTHVQYMQTAQTPQTECIGKGRTRNRASGLSMAPLRELSSSWLASCLLCMCVLADGQMMTMMTVSCTPRTVRLLGHSNMSSVLWVVHGICADLPGVWLWFLRTEELEKGLGEKRLVYEPAVTGE